MHNLIYIEGSTSIAWCQHNERTVETSTYAMTSLGGHPCHSCNEDLSEPHRSGGGGMQQTSELRAVSLMCRAEGMVLWRTSREASSPHLNDDLHGGIPAAVAMEELSAPSWQQWWWYAANI